MALKVVKAAQIVNEFDRKIKDKALPEGVNMDVLRQSLDVVNGLLKQSQGGDSIKFNDYRQFRQYLMAVNQLESISQGFSVKQAVEKGFLSYKSLNELVKSWRERKGIVYVPRQLADSAIQRYRLFHQAFDPVAEYRINMDKYTNVLEGLMKKIAQRNKDKGEDIEHGDLKNLVIDPRELTQLEREALGQVSQWMNLPTDPKYQFSAEDLQDLFRIAMAPRPQNQQKLLEQEIAEGRAKAAKSLAEIQAQEQAENEAKRQQGLNGQKITGGALGQAPLSPTPTGPSLQPRQTVIGTEGNVPKGAEQLGKMYSKYSSGIGLAEPTLAEISDDLQKVGLNPDKNDDTYKKHLGYLNPQLAPASTSLFSSGLSGNWERVLDPQLKTPDKQAFSAKITEITDFEDDLRKLRDRIDDLHLQIFQAAAKNEDFSLLAGEEDLLINEFNQKCEDFEKATGEKWSSSFNIGDLKAVAEAKFAELHPDIEKATPEEIIEEAEEEAAAPVAPAAPLPPTAAAPVTPGAAGTAPAGRAKDYYAIFGLSPSASQAQIRLRYQDLQNQYRYSATAGNPAVMQQLQDINEAFGVLDDPLQKAQYDRQRSATRVLTPPPAAAPAPAAPAASGGVRVRHKSKQRESREKLLQQVYLGQKSPMALFSMSRLEDEDSIRLALGQSITGLKLRIKNKAKTVMIRGAVNLAEFSGRTTSRIAKNIHVNLKRQFRAYHKVTVKVKLARRALKRAKRSNQLIKFLINTFFSNTVGKAVKVIKNVVKTVGRVSGVTRAVANMRTAQYLGQKISQLLPGVSQGGAALRGAAGRVLDVIEGTGIRLRAGLQLVRTTGGRIITLVHDTGTVLGHIGKGLPQGAIGALGGLIVAGPAGAVAGFAMGNTVGTLNSMLGSSRFIGPKWLTDFQHKYGWGDLKDKFGWRLDANQDPNLANKLAGMTNVYGSKFNSFTRLVRALGAGSTFATIGAVLGGLSGAPLAGAALGFGIGFGGRQLLDRFNGARIWAAMAHGLPQGIFQKLAAIPTFAIINQIHGTNWMIDQVWQIKDQYHGDISKYLAANFSGVMGVFNGLSAFTYIQSSLAISRIVLRAFGIIRTTLTGLRGAIAANLNPATLGMTAGMILGPAIAAALGIPLGIGAVVGATAGGVIGGIVGALAGGSVAAGLTAISGGALAFIAVPLGTFLSSLVGSIFGSVAGAGVGSFIDRTIGRAANSLIGAVQGIQALFNLINGLGEGINFDNIVPMALGLVGLFTTLTRLTQNSSANDCTKAGQCPSGSSASINNFNKYDLSNYGVMLVTDKQIAISSNNMQTIIQTLDDFSKKYDLHNSRQKVVLVVGIDHNYSDANLVILSIADAKLQNAAELKEALTGQLNFLMATGNSNRVSLGNP